MSDRIVLLVEDDPDQVTLALRAFRKHGVADAVDDIVVMRDGAEALDYLLGTGAYAGRDASETPEFVLLDVNLPKMSGLEVLKRLRADNRTELLPVILYSSSDERADVVEGYRSGANSYVAKPSDFDTFSEVMRTLGWYWLEWNKAP